MNALQRLIRRHCEVTGQSQADIARRGGLPKQTVSWIARGEGTGATEPDTLNKLAAGMGVDPRRVHYAAAQAAGYDLEETTSDEDELEVLSAMVRTLDPPRRRAVERRAAELLREMHADETERGAG